VKVTFCYSRFTTATLGGALAGTTVKLDRTATEM